MEFSDGKIQSRGNLVSFFLQTAIYIYIYIYIYICVCVCVCVWWLLSQEMDPVTRVQNLDEAVCILHFANTLRKGMNPTILRPAMDK